MPANLTPEYLALEERYRKSRDPKEKLALLQAMLSALPKHKGTDKLHAELRRKISQLKKELQKAKEKKKGYDPYHIEKEGVGQIALVGLPNSGKSSLLSGVTHAQSPIADFPFTTHAPVVGMMPFEDVQIQLVDLPPIDPHHTEPWVWRIIRQADAVAVILDLLSSVALADWEEVEGILAQRHIQLKATDMNGYSRGKTVKKAAIWASRWEGEDGEMNLMLLKEKLQSVFPIVPFSLHEKRNLEGIKQSAFDLLGFIRVYSKPSAKDKLDKPFLLKKGATVEDFAAQVHQDFVRHLKYARIWGSGEFPGQMVGRTHPLQDGDVVELVM